MAAGYLRALSHGEVEVYSAGSEPADSLNPVAVQAMREEGIEIAAFVPRILTPDAVLQADVVITMGCGDVCPVFPGKRYEDWDLTDPAGRELPEVRGIRDEIRRRVEVLISELTQ
jgi:protein-tyrosine-phosphatase